jgi:hypothetical protein
MRGITFTQSLCDIDSDVEIGIRRTGALIVHENLIVAWFDMHAFPPSLTSAYVYRVLASVE